MLDSGFAAAAAYLLVQQQLSTHDTQGHPGLPRPLRCVMLGTNHFTILPLACLSSAAAWRTPLGDVPLDTGLNAALAEQGLPYDDTPHKWVGLQRVDGGCTVLYCAVLQISRWKGAAVYDLCNEAGQLPSVQTPMARPAVHPSAAWSTRLKTSCPSCNTLWTARPAQAGAAAA